MNKLAVVLWSRLYFDLAPYLAEHAADGTTLLAFYHRVLGEAATDLYLAGPGGHGKARHAALADYFRNKADPAHDGSWELRSRPLTELPLHLARAGSTKKLEPLLSDLSYLALVSPQAPFTVSSTTTRSSVPNPPRRSRLGECSSRSTRNACASTPGSLSHWSTTRGSRRRRSRSRRPIGRDPGRALRPRRSPAGRAKRHATDDLGPRKPGMTALGRSPSRASDSSACLERLGALRVLDIGSMQEATHTLSIATERPLVLACAPDASSLASRRVRRRGLLPLPGRDGRPSRRTRIGDQMRYQLPGFTDPVVVWDPGPIGCRHKAAAWQRFPEPTSARQRAFPPTTATTLPTCFFKGRRLTVLRHGSDTVVFADDRLIDQRTGTEASAACACGNAGVAVAYTDGQLVMYGGDDALSARHAISPGLISGGVGWDTTSLLWNAQEGGLTTWRPDDSEPAPSRTTRCSPAGFSGSLAMDPPGRRRHARRHVPLRGDVRDRRGRGGGLLAHRRPARRIVWRAIERRAYDWWLIDSEPPREVLLEADVKGRLYYGLDGRETIYAASGNAPGLRLDLRTGDALRLEGGPGMMNSAAADSAAGCWFANRAGDIQYVDLEGQWSDVVNVDQRDVFGAQLIKCGDLLLSWGYSNHILETGPEPATTLIFHRKSANRRESAERAAIRVIHPSEGRCQALWYSPSDGQLLALWFPFDGRRETSRIRSGPLDDWMSGIETEEETLGLTPFAYEHGALAPDGRHLALVCRSGGIFCLRLADNTVVATLAGSARFSVVAPGPTRSAFWLVEGESRLFRCSLEGEST